MAFVLDASAAAAWVLPDEDAAVADLALNRLGEETARVPEAFRREPRNQLPSAERRGRTDRRHADASMMRLRRLPIVCPGETDDREILAPARAHRLTACDASHHTLAVREDCALASLDRRLNEAAVAEGIAPFA